MVFCALTLIAVPAGGARRAFLRASMRTDRAHESIQRHRELQRQGRKLVYEGISQPEIAGLESSCTAAQGRLSTVGLIVTDRGRALQSGDQPRGRLIAESQQEVAAATHAIVRQ